MTFMRYVGSKWTRSKLYPKPLARIVEPFAGSAGYSLRYSDRDVTLIDSDERVCQAWHWIIAAESRDWLSLPLLEPGQSVDDVAWPCEEAKMAVRYNINVGAGPHRTQTRWQLWNARRRELFASRAGMCSHWRIINASYERAEQCIDAVTTTFVDPPYQHNQYYREKFSDYEALAQWVRGLSGHVIVCEGAGADWLPFRELADVKAHPRSKEKTAKELVWTQFSR